MKTVVMRVVPHPKLRRDYVGRRVRTRGDMANALAKVPAGSLATVRYWSPAGGTLDFDPCEHCGIRVRITRVSPHDFEFVEIA